MTMGMHGAEDVQQIWNKLEARRRFEVARDAQETYTDAIEGQTSRRELSRLWAEREYTIKMYDEMKGYLLE